VVTWWQVRLQHTRCSCLRTLLTFNGCTSLRRKIFQFTART